MQRYSMTTNRSTRSTHCAAAFSMPSVRQIAPRTSGASPSIFAMLLYFFAVKMLVGVW